MALHVDFDHKIGYYTLKQGERKYKIYFCACNALCAEIHFHKDEQGKKRGLLHSFFGDLQHVRNCAKAGCLNHYGNGVTLYAKEMSNDLWKMAKIFTEHGIKVTIK